MLPKLTLVLGGAASGKSRFAEELVFATKLPRTYIATAQAFDGEMRDKIVQHQIDRGANWTTIEAPLDLPSQIETAPQIGVILIDCLTLWLSNLLLEDRDIEHNRNALTASLLAKNCPIICVSNEVGHGIVPQNPLARRFRNEQGRLNQVVAAQADLAVMVTAGLPMVLKGSLPKGAL